MQLAIGFGVSMPSWPHTPKAFPDYQVLKPEAPGANKASWAAGMGYRRPDALDTVELDALDKSNPV